MTAGCSDARCRLRASTLGRDRHWAEQPDGKCGTFWSCHERNDDGSFCSYKPEGR